MKKMTPLIILAISFLTACGITDPHENVRGTGPLVSSSIDVASFNKIRSSGIANVNIVKADSQVVTLTAQQEILDVITSRVINSMLILGFEENVSIHTNKDITIDIQSPEINGIEAEGTGNWYLSGALQEDLTIDISGTGDLHAYDQEVNVCNISSTGTGSAWLRVVDQLDVDLTGTGNIHYKGRPIMNADVSGTGQLISDN